MVKYLARAEVVELADALDSKSPSPSHVGMARSLDFTGLLTIEYVRDF
jgi:hypothetical protein